MELTALRQVLRRLTFASTPVAERQFRDASAAQVVRTLCEASRTARVPAAPAYVRGTWTNGALRLVGMTAEAHDALLAAQVAAARRDVELLRQWWLGEMVAGPVPLRENMVLFFQGLFGSSTASVDVPHAVYGCNALLRETCLGTVPALLDRLVVNPAMMIQIGMDEHTKERVSDRPAKLILDYWTVGSGEYADADVEELSRALTGWTLAAAPGTVPTAIDARAPRAARRTGLVPTFDPQQFDRGTKTILGSSGAFDARAAMAVLAHHPATARRIGRQLLRHFGIADPARRLEHQLVQTYAATRGAIEPLLADIVTSPEFASSESQWSLVKSPVHLAVGACRQLELQTPPLAAISAWLSAAGQTLFDTPNGGEGGWPGELAWLAPAERLLVRYQLPVVLGGQPPALGIRTTRNAAPPQIRLRTGTSLQRASTSALLARLDPAPGIDAAQLERTTASARDRQSETIRRVMTTPEYQLA